MWEDDRELVVDTDVVSGDDSGVEEHDDGLYNPRLLGDTQNCRRMRCVKILLNASCWTAKKRLQTNVPGVRLATSYLQWLRSPARLHLWLGWGQSQRCIILQFERPDPINRD